MHEEEHSCIERDDDKERCDETPNRQQANLTKIASAEGLRRQRITGIEESLQESSLKHVARQIGQGKPIQIQMPKVPCALLKKADQIEPAYLRIIYKMIFHNGRVKKKNARSRRKARRV